MKGANRSGGGNMEWSSTARLLFKTGWLKKLKHRHFFEQQNSNTKTPKGSMNHSLLGLGNWCSVGAGETLKCRG